MSTRFLLHSIRYQEYPNEPREWLLNDSSFGVINLIVGRNSSGKSRTLNIITALANMINGKLNAMFEHCTFNVIFSSDNQRYHYDITFGNQVIVHEQLHKGNLLLFSREADGSGKIFSDEVQSFLSLKIQEKQLALVLKRDAAQHAFLEEIHQWAVSLKNYRFGSDFGQSVFFAYRDFDGAEGQLSTTNGPRVVPEAHEVAKLYWHSFEKFKEPFDEAILKDLQTVGYDCVDVGAEQVPGLFVPGVIPVALFLRERNLNVNTVQANMSTGMYRVLAILVHLNVSVFENAPCCIVIDDIGEGLDYERSTALIKLLIQKCHENHFQLLMSSNDRFVMNAVDLKYWHVVDRQANNVQILSHQNRREIFEEFKYLGMSNFDFFSNRLYEGDKQ